MIFVNRNFYSHVQIFCETPMNTFLILVENKNIATETETLARLDFLLHKRK